MGEPAADWGVPSGSKMPEGRSLRADWRVVDERQRDLGWCIYAVSPDAVRGNVRRVASDLSHEDAAFIVTLYEKEQSR